LVVMTSRMNIPTPSFSRSMTDILHRSSRRSQRQGFFSKASH
jgi:hypothetical protein